MTGAFGLNGCHLPRRPRDRFVEANWRLDIWKDLHRCGAPVNQTVTEIRWGEKSCQLAARTPNLWIGGTCVLIVWDEPMPGVDRPWFECPVCHRRSRHLYLRDPIACRRCLGLKYLAENGQQAPGVGVGRVERLRARLGNCDTRPFAKLPACPPGRHRAYHERLVAMIHAEEAKLAEHLGGIVHDLKRRIRVRKGRGKW
jgi:hypothetical protein